jgi:myo-inositol-1-phosphate synthase
MNPIRVALAGTGNCAYSFAQFVAMAQAHPDVRLPGLMCDTIGPYRLSDVTIVAAFDVDEKKVGRTIRQAFTAPTISATSFFPLGADAGAEVFPAPVLDGVDGPLRQTIRIADAANATTAEEVAKHLADQEVDVLTILLPTGASHATQMFARAALAAGVSVVNGTPTELARRDDLSREFGSSGLTLLGDDLRSHMGATTLHTALIELLMSRGLVPQSTYQLNIGGNTDFLNLADSQRSSSKFASKANALFAAGVTDLDVSAGPTGYVRHLGDTKVCYLDIRAESVLGSIVEVEVKLKVEDSPNAAGVLANAVRAAKVAQDRGLFGTVNDASPMLFKSPPHGLPESLARAAFVDFAS